MNYWDLIFPNKEILQVGTITDVVSDHKDVRALDSGS